MPIQKLLYSSAWLAWGYVSQDPGFFVLSVARFDDVGYACDFSVDLGHHQVRDAFPIIFGIGDVVSGDQCHGNFTLQAPFDLLTNRRKASEDVPKIQFKFLSCWSYDVKCLPDIAFDQPHFVVGQTAAFADIRIRPLG